MLFEIQKRSCSAETVLKRVWKQISLRDLQSLKLANKFEVNGNVHNVHKQHLGTPKSSTKPANQGRIAVDKMEHSKSNVHCILKRPHKKSYIPKLIHTLKGDDSYRYNSERYHHLNCAYNFFFRYSLDILLRLFIWLKCFLFCQWFW